MILWSTIVVLANLASVDASGLSHRVADIYLGDHRQPASPPTASTEPSVVPLDPKIYDNYTGDYLLGPESVVTLSRDGDQLWVQQTGYSKVRLFPASTTDFFTKGSGQRFHFVMGNGARARQVTVTDAETNGSASRFDRFAPTPAQLGEYAGVYYRDELQVLYVLAERDGKMTVEYPRGVTEIEPTESDTFIGRFPVRYLRFDRDSQTHAVRGLTVTNGSLRNVAFVKTDLRP